MISGIISAVLGSVIKNAVTAKITGTKPKPAPYDAKGLVQSKTVWGATVALVMYLGQAGWPDSPAAWGVVASAIVVWGFTLYGRFKSKKAIG